MLKHNTNNANWEIMASNQFLNFVVDRPQRIMLALYGALYGVSRGIGHYEH